MSDMKEVIDEIKARCDIASIISDYIKITPSGGNYKGLCPFHVEKTPSFYINTSKQIYKCFGCGEGGDVINFIMKIENLEFMDAVKFLASKYGIDINLDIDEDTKKRMELIKRYQDIHVEAARYYFNNLINTRNNGYVYLRKRGLEEKTIKKFGLGFSPDSWRSLIDYLVEKKGVSIEELIECGLAGKSSKSDIYYDKFRNRVIFPIFDYRGNVIGFGGRVLDDSLPKYLNSPDTLIFNKRHNLYGLNFARKNIKDRSVVLVEGYMDLISLYQYGIKNVVATLGTAITQQQAILIKRYADLVIISYDSDEAGIKAALRAIDILCKEGISVKVLNLKDAKDPDDYVRKYGTKSYMEAIDGAVDRTKFRIDVMKRNYNLENPEESIDFAKKASNLIKTIKSPVEIDYYAGYIGNLSGIDTDSIKREVYGKSYNGNNRKNTSQYRKYDYNKETIEKIDVIKHGEENVEIMLIKMILQDRDVRETSILKMDCDDFIFEESKKIFEAIIDNNINYNDFISGKFEIHIGDDYKKSITDSDISSIDLSNNREIDELIKTVKRNSMKNKIDVLIKKQHKLEEERKNISSVNSEDTKKVDIEIMNTALQIVEMNKKLRIL